MRVSLYRGACVCELTCISRSVAFYTPDAGVSESLYIATHSKPDCDPQQAAAWTGYGDTNLYYSRISGGRMSSQELNLSTSIRLWEERPFASARTFRS